MKYFGAKLIRKTNAINFNGTSDKGEITDLHKFLKKPNSAVLSWNNLTIKLFVDGPKVSVGMR